MKRSGVGLWTSFIFLMVVMSCNNEPEFDAVKQLRKDIEFIDSYLSDNAIDAYTDVSGIRFVINELGAFGLPPRRSHTVKTEYYGRLIGSSTLVDYRLYEGLLGQLTLPGLIEALEIFPVGTKATVYVPSGLAYGNVSTALIPENSILEYDIELIDVTPSSQELSQLASDTVAINEYLVNNSITAQSATDGVKYVITETGAGALPDWYDKIKVTYTSRLLTNPESSFYSGTNEPVSGFDSRVVDYLPGLQVAFQKLPAGSKATVYLPSVHGFGSAGAGGGVVPPNANLIYEIELLEIVE